MIVDKKTTCVRVLHIYSDNQTRFFLQKKKINSVTEKLYTNGITNQSAFFVLVSN